MFYTTLEFTQNPGFPQVLVLRTAGVKGERRKDGGRQFQPNPPFKAETDFCLGISLDEFLSKNSW